MSYLLRHFSAKPCWRKAKPFPETKLRQDENINAAIEVSLHETSLKQAMFTVVLYTFGQNFYIFRCRGTPNQFPPKRHQYHLQTPIVFTGINHVETFAI